MVLRLQVHLSMILLLGASSVFAQSVSLQDVKDAGARKSSYRKQSQSTELTAEPAANLSAFKEHIQPLLEKSCAQCHGSDQQEGNFRVDTLDPNLIDGQDTDWWLEVFHVLSNSEMPPADEATLDDQGRGLIIDWLSRELQVASQVARSRQAPSSFRRLTRYEYNYALQDLLGLPYDFADDLPPESSSEDGFLNSSESLQISATQFETYRQIARDALSKATVRGERPTPIYYAVTMDFGLEKERERFEADLEKVRRRFADDPDKLEREIAKRKSGKVSGAHFRNVETGFSAAARWNYRGARYAHTPTNQKPETPGTLADVAVIPAGQRLIIDLGDHLPNAGKLKLQIRAGRVAEQDAWAGALRIYFGHQASNNSRAEERVGDVDLVIDTDTDDLEFYDVEIPLSEVVRNPFRGVQELGMTPNPAEYVMLQNSSDLPVDIQIDYIDITAPAFESWPPESHRRIFFDRADESDEMEYVRQVLARFMERAWRRRPTDGELEQKVSLYSRLRPHCDDNQEATLEVLATVLSSPKFLYLAPKSSLSDDNALATRLAVFLWSSLPDRQLLDLAATGRLSDPEVLKQQVDRMLADPRARRFSKHFVRQWLGIQRLNHVEADEHLRWAMQQEPVELFEEMLRGNHSVMDFLHCDYAMVNGRLARHYNLPNVHGPRFQRVSLSPGHRRGGLLTQAGLLAMNSDGKDSHPLKRGIWLLESILNDPPPPPPPAVPEIDLSDPDILKLTLKERMEDHRNDPACMSCHQRIDPWGIAFENFDALGNWRTTIAGKPVDASSTLFNSQELHGMDGLKRFLLANRQDQFAHAMTHKLTAYALGRPIGFADRAQADRITRQLRRQGDGLRTLIHLIVTSELFRL